jgi:GTPase SAR1 family protein
MSIKKDSIKILEDALITLRRYENTEELIKEIESIKNRISEPLRIVVIGTMKAGKSTLINSLLKDRVLFTGSVEKTSVPTWFRYAESKSIKIVYSNGNEKIEPFENLEKWTVKEKTDKNTKIDDVSYVEIMYPDKILKSIELIDTPGFGGDVKASLKSIGFLGFGEMENGNSKYVSKESSKAEAILFAFSGDDAEKNMETLNKFQKDLAEYNISQINAICVFTKGDLYWDKEDDSEPLEFAKAERDRLMKQRSEKNIMLDVYPVCARVMEAVFEFSEMEKDILEKLSILEPDKLINIISKDSDHLNLQSHELEYIKNIGITDSDIKHILSICPVYGVYVIASMLNEGYGWEDIVDKLDKRTHVEELRKKVYSHFGNRATIIKIDYMFLYLRSLIVKKMGSLNRNSETYSVLEGLKDKIVDMRTDHIVFREMNNLKDYYNGRIEFDDEKTEKIFLQMMGEYGMSCEKRLGFTDDTGIRKLAKKTLETKRFWDEKSADHFIGRRLKEVAVDMSRSCDYIYDHLAWLLGE